MINDEITWMLNFSPCSRIADSALMAGHIKLVKSLLSCEGVSKVINISIDVYDKGGGSLAKFKNLS